MVGSTLLHDTPQLSVEVAHNARPTTEAEDLLRYEVGAILVYCRVKLEEGRKRDTLLRGNIGASITSFNDVDGTSTRCCIGGGRRGGRRGLRCDRSGCVGVITRSGVGGISGIGTGRVRRRRGRGRGVQIGTLWWTDVASVVNLEVGTRVGELDVVPLCCCAVPADVGRENLRVVVQGRSSTAGDIDGGAVHVHFTVASVVEPGPGEDGLAVLGIGGDGEVEFVL